MKTSFTLLRRATVLAGIAVACAITISSTPQRADAILRRGHYLSEGENEGASGGGSAETKTLKIQVVEPDSARKEVAWLGVSTDEAPDALSAQLGLQPGDGLVVLFVQADSPAAKAGLQKNDVLVELGDQLLVHPGQFRKLVRRQKEGDKIKLTLYRNGKKQTASATLAKTTERAGLDNSNHELWAQGNSPVISETIHRQYKDLHQSVVYPGRLTKQIVELEVQRSVDEARQALHDALTHNRAFALALGSEATNVEALAKSEAELGSNATVTVKKNAKSVTTMVKTAQTGIYVIVAYARKRLTVQAKDGKLLFDGEIETTEQQQKIPADLWHKAQLMIEEMAASRDTARPKAKSPEDPLHEKR